VKKAINSENQGIIITTFAIPQKTEKCLSGRKSTPGKCVYGKTVSRVRISPSPQLKITKSLICINMGFFNFYKLIGDKFGSKDVLVYFVNIAL
jgi:hypothetical protein